MTAEIGGRFVQEMRSPGSWVTVRPVAVAETWQVAQVGACE
jgi:hypothetical protein